MDYVNPMYRMISANAPEKCTAALPEFKFRPPVCKDRQPERTLPALSYKII